MQKVIFKQKKISKIQDIHNIMKADCGLILFKMSFKGPEKNNMTRKVQNSRTKKKWSLWLCIKTD